MDALGGPVHVEGISLCPISHPDPHAVLAVRTPGELPVAHDDDAAIHGDIVRRFDEISAAKGALGRFPGNQVMALVKSLSIKKE